MKRSVKRPQLRSVDRLFWVLLSRIWSNWREALAEAVPILRIGLRAVEKKNYPILLVFWPVFCVASKVTYIQYAPFDAP
jgi:hypothetical protein